MSCLGRRSPQVFDGFIPEILTETYPFQGVLGMSALLGLGYNMGVPGFYILKSDPHCEDKGAELNPSW